MGIWTHGRVSHPGWLFETEIQKSPLEVAAGINSVSKDINIIEITLSYSTNGFEAEFFENLKHQLKGYKGEGIWWKFDKRTPSDERYVICTFICQKQGN